jgi:hypothetical protein
MAGKYIFFPKIWRESMSLCLSVVRHLVRTKRYGGTANLRVCPSAAEHVRAALRRDADQKAAQSLSLPPQQYLSSATMASATTAPTEKAAAIPPAVVTKDIYLIQYNAFCCLGWAYILAIGIPTFVQSVISSTASGTSVIDALKLAGGQLYFATPVTAGLAEETEPSIATMLTLVQSAALLEIVHAALGLVRSPVFVTMMQVGSRIVALHMINHSPTAQSKSKNSVEYIVIVLCSEADFLQLIAHFGNSLTQL